MRGTRIQLSFSLTDEEGEPVGIQRAREDDEEEAEREHEREEDDGCERLVRVHALVPTLQPCSHGGCVPRARGWGWMWVMGDGEEGGEVVGRRRIRHGHTQARAVQPGQPAMSPKEADGGE